LLDYRDELRVIEFEIRAVHDKAQAAGRCGREAVEQVECRKQLDEALIGIDLAEKTKRDAALSDVERARRRGSDRSSGIVEHDDLPIGYPPRNVPLPQKLARRYEHIDFLEMRANEQLAPKEFPRRDAAEALGAIMRVRTGAERHIGGLDHLPMVVTDGQVFTKGDDNSDLRIEPTNHRYQLQPELSVMVKVDNIGRDPGHERRKPVDQLTRAL
jgi:hypothetical protein